MSSGLIVAAHNTITFPISSGSTTAVYSSIRFINDTTLDNLLGSVNPVLNGSGSSSSGLDWSVPTIQLIPGHTSIMYYGNIDTSYGGLIKDNFIPTKMYIWYYIETTVG